MSEEIEKKSKKALTVVWMTRYGLERPMKRLCEKPGWPNQTTCGEVMYENTHFTDERKAWKRLIQENYAGLNLDTCRVHEARKALSEAETAAATAGIVYTTMIEAHREWAREQEAETPAELNPITK